MTDPNQEIHYYELWYNEMQGNAMQYQKKSAGGRKAFHEKADVNVFKLELANLEVSRVAFLVSKISNNSLFVFMW